MPPALPWVWLCCQIPSWRRSDPYLFGNVLGVSNTDPSGDLRWAVILVAVFCSTRSGVVRSILAATLRLPLDALNYLLLVLIALTVVVSLQAVGVALMVICSSPRRLPPTC